MAVGIPRDSDLLCIPAHPEMGDIGAGLELRRLPTGELVAIGFSSPRRLVEALGPDQPWIGLPAAAFGALAASAGARRVLIDPQSAPGNPRWTAQTLREAMEAVV